MRTNEYPQARVNKMPLLAPLRSAMQQNDPNYQFQPAKFFQWRKWVISIVAVAAMFGIAAAIINLSPRQDPMLAMLTGARPFMATYAELANRGYSPWLPQWEIGSAPVQILILVLVLLAVGGFVVAKYRSRKAETQWTQIAQAAREAKTGASNLS